MKTAPGPRLRTEHRARHPQPHLPTVVPSYRQSPNFTPCASGSSVLQFMVFVWRRM
jgi:hypothetical protein